MTPDEFRAQLGRLSLSGGSAADLLGVDPRTLRRWVAGERAIPEPVRRLLLACERDDDLVDTLRSMR